MKQQICIFTGARPNFVKVAPLIRAIEHNDECSYQLVYAGREDDPTSAIWRCPVLMSVWVSTARISTS